MRRGTRKLSPCMEALEAKELLSAGLPVLTMHTVEHVEGRINAIMGMLARTNDRARAGEALTTLSRTIPFGARQLAPAWRFDLRLYQPVIAGSGNAMNKQVFGDLDRYLIAGVSQRAFRVLGPGSSIYYVLSPAPTPTPPPKTPTPPPATGGGNPGGSAPTATYSTVNLVNQFGSTLWIDLYYSNIGPAGWQAVSVPPYSAFTVQGSNESLWIAIWKNSSTNRPPDFTASTNYTGFQMNGGTITITSLGGFPNISVTPG
ncbi:MAG: hypothetical protein ACYC61_09040 [Isosphaeraceae bacterium]